VVFGGVLQQTLKEFNRSVAFRLTQDSKALGHSHRSNISFDITSSKKMTELNSMIFL